MKILCGMEICLKSILFLKETKSANMNIFRFFLSSFKSFVKVDLSYVLTINLFHYS